MVGNTIIWNPVALDYLLKERAGPVGRDLAKRSLRVLTAAKLQVGVRTGALKASITMNHERDLLGQKYVIGSNLKYALLHHEGTRPHVILPVRARNLVFTSKGRVIITNRVNHPGTRPNRYLTDNLYLALGD